MSSPALVMVPIIAPVLYFVSISAGGAFLTFPVIGWLDLKLKDVVCNIPDALVTPERITAVEIGEPLAEPV